MISDSLITFKSLNKGLECSVKLEKVIILVAFFCNLKKKVAKLTNMHYPKQLYNNLRMALLRCNTGLATFLCLGNSEAKREYLYFF